MYQDRGESIYKIIPQAPPQEEKLKMHRSKYNPLTPATSSTFHIRGSTQPQLTNISGSASDPPVAPLSARTFGAVPGSDKPIASKYVKSYSRTSRVPALAELKKTNPDLLKPTCLSARLKPVVPKHTERPVFNLVTAKNFIVANAVDTILAPPKRSHDVTKDFMNKEDYGKAPKYLSQIKQDIQDEFAYVRELQQHHQDIHKSKIRPLEEEERLELINGLKAKWEVLNTAHQATTHLTKICGISKAKRKEKYETELSQIEKDIEKLNRSNICVKDY